MVFFCSPIVCLEIKSLELKQCTSFSILDSSLTSKYSVFQKKVIFLSNLNLIYATFRLVLKEGKKSRIVTEEGGHTLQQNDRSIKITVKPR